MYLLLFKATKPYVSLIRLLILPVILETFDLIILNCVYKLATYLNKTLYIQDFLQYICTKSTLF